MQKLKSIIAKWPWLWMAFVLLCVAAYFLLRFFLPPYEFIPPIVAALGSIAFVLFWHLSTRRNIQQYVVEMGMSLDKGLSQKMDSLALPYAVLDDKGRLRAEVLNIHGQLPGFIIQIHLCCRPGNVFITIDNQRLSRIGGLPPVR